MSDGLVDEHGKPLPSAPPETRMGLAIKNGKLMLLFGAAVEMVVLERNQALDLARAIRQMAKQLPPHENGKLEKEDLS